MATAISSDIKPSGSSTSMTASSPKAGGINSSSGSTTTATATSVSTTQSRPNSTAGASVPTEPRLLDRRRLQDLVKEVDPMEQLDEDVEELLMQITDDFIDNVVTNACQYAKHRKASTVEVRDVQLHLERKWNMWVPGFGGEDIRPYKKSFMTEAHKQRIALIKKTQKKI